MKKHKVWHYAVIVNGKKIRQRTIPDTLTADEEAEIKATMEMIAYRYGGKVTKGYTLK